MKDVHVPVLLKEMLTAMAPKADELYLDGTFGAGGYSKALLNLVNCRVYAIDRDASVKKYVKSINNAFSHKFKLFIIKFSKMDSILENEKVDGVVLDLGVSSMQLDESSRGFSFMKDGPLDMRMSNDEKFDATTLVNAFREDEIASVIYKYSGERYAKKIARAIVCYRNKRLITTTSELAKIVRSVAPRKAGDKIDPATRTFQALRIWVNNELEELEKGIDAATRILKIGGRLIIVSFHSLEDKIVKDKFNLLCGKTVNENRNYPTHEREKGIVNFVKLNEKVITPTKREINKNIRSRSARLRAIKRVL